MASIIKAAVADGVVTCLWVFCASTLGALTTIIATYLSVEANAIANLAIITSLVLVLVTLFDAVGALLGGSFNPTGTASFYAAGVGDDNLFSIAVRLPAQTIGAVGGALAILELMPKQYKHLVDGPALKVDIHTGAAAEGILTFLISFAVLWIILRGPSSYIAKTLLITICTIAVVITGSGYTGPSLNPANAFGWAYVYKNHNTWEQFYVYWICPYVGAILAAWVFRILFPPQVKVKKA